MSGRDDDQRQQDLAATSESLKSDALQIAQIEEQKQGLDIDDPRLDRLSRDAERLAGEVHRKSRIERALSEERPTESDGPPIRAN